MINLFSVSSVLASVLCLAVSLTSFYTRKTKAHLALGSIALMISIWSLFPAANAYIKDPILALRVTRILYVAAAAVPFAFLYLTLAILSDLPSPFERRLLAAGKVMTVVFAASSFSQLYIVSVGRNGNTCFVSPGPLFPFFIGYFILVCGWTFYRLWIEYPATNGLKRNQLKYFFAGFSLAYVAGALHFMTAYLRSEPFPHDLLVAAFTLTIGYAILRLRLMDFALLIRWGAAYVALLVTLTVIAIPLVTLCERFSNRFFHVQSGLSTLAIACALVFVFEPLRKSVTRTVDRLIFKSPDFSSLSAGIEAVLAKGGDMKTVATSIADQLKQIFKSDHAGVAIWDFHGGQFDLIPTKAFEKEIFSRMNEPLIRTDFLVRTLETERRLFWQGIVTSDEVSALGARAFPGERTTFWKMRRTMRWIGAAVCVPLMLNKQLMGFLIIGGKMSGSPFSVEDRRFLSHLSGSITAAFSGLVLEDKFLDSNLRSATR